MKLRISPRLEVVPKEKVYQTLIPQISSLLEDETDAVANMANVAAALRQTFSFFWVGFYLVKNDVLVLGPFQGPIACTRIAYGKGVCGKVWEIKQPLIVPDVEQFEGHIACSSLSKSEIVLPILLNDTVLGVLDVDSDQLNHFDETDQQYLQMIVDDLAPIIGKKLDH